MLEYFAYFNAPTSNDVALIIGTENSFCAED